MRRLPLTPETLVVLAWNAYVGNRARRVRAALVGWIALHAPHIIVVNEAKGHRAVLERVAHECGYTLYQETPAAHPKRGRVVDDTGDTAVLVAPGVEVIRRRVARMAVPWLVLRYRRRHTPGRSEVLVVEHAGRRFKVRACHWPTHGAEGPNRAAWLEAAARAKGWALATLRPTLIVGDLNETLERVAAWFGRRFTVVGHRIDLLVARFVASVEHRRLGKGGSDHHAQVYAVTPRPRRRRRRRA